MDELRSAVERARAGLTELAAVQRQYDAVGWRISKPASAKMRHIVLHLTACVGSLSAVCEGQEHLELEPSATGDEVRDKLAQRQADIATLLISAVQLAELANIDPGALLAATYVRNAKRFAPTSAFATLPVD